MVQDKYKQDVKKFENFDNLCDDLRKVMTNNMCTDNFKEIKETDNNKTS